MTIQRAEVAIRDNQEEITKTAAGTVTAGQIVRVEYDDTARKIDLHIALRKMADAVLILEQ